MDKTEYGSPTKAAPLAGAPSARPVTDSGWFWLQLFAAVALLALVVITPKYDKRQGQLERRFEGRQRATASSQVEESDSATASEPEPELAPPVETRVRHVSLLPLKGAAVAALLFASWKLRGWRRRQRTALVAGESSA